MIKRPYFLHVDTDSWKLKVDQEVLQWAWSKMGVTIWSQDSKIGFISRRNYVNKLIFGVLVKIQKTHRSQEWIDEISWFFACWYKFRKVDSYFDYYWVGIVRNGWSLIDHRTLNSDVSHKWFDELNRLIERFLHVHSAGIIFGLMTNLLCIFEI